MIQHATVRSKMPATMEATSRAVVKIPSLTSSVVVPAGVCGSRKSTRSASVIATEEAAAKMRESVTPS